MKTVPMVLPLTPKLVVLVFQMKYIYAILSMDSISPITGNYAEKKHFIFVNLSTKKYVKYSGPS